MTLAHQLHQESREEGQQLTLLKLLSLKFGAVAPEYEAQLREASVDQLDLYLERALTAPNLAAVFSRTAKSRSKAGSKSRSKSRSKSGSARSTR